MVLNGHFFALLFALIFRFLTALNFGAEGGGVPTQARRVSPSHEYAQSCVESGERERDVGKKVRTRTMEWP